MNALAHAATTAPGDLALARLGEERLGRVNAASRRFFEKEAAQMAQACLAMARRFHCGGRLLVCADSASASDACHISVEFLHPVLVGKRALPAMVLDGDAATQLAVLGRSQDIVMALSADGDDPRLAAMLGAARAAGLLTIGLAGGAGGAMAQEPPDHLFVVPEDDPTIVQEVQETCYHVLYELVHVFFEHKGLL